MFRPKDHQIEFSNQQIDDIFSPILDRFLGSPSVPMSDLPMFNGSGIYGLFLTEQSKTIYSDYVPHGYPVYVGKATQKGGRQGQAQADKRALRGRLMKHRRSILQVDNLSDEDFIVKFLIVSDRASTLISAMESYLIKELTPLWNSYIDGFGNNAPGAGRYNQSPSEWDTLHPGRYYALQLTGEAKDFGEIMKKLEIYRNVWSG